MFGIGNYGYGMPWDRPEEQPVAATSSDPAAPVDPTAAPTATTTAAPIGAMPTLQPRPQFNSGGFQGNFDRGSFNLPGFSTTGSKPGTAWSFGDLKGNMPGRGGGGNLSWGGGPEAQPLPAPGADPAAPGATPAAGAPPGGPPRWGGMMSSLFQPPSGGAAGNGGFPATFPRIGQLFPGGGGHGGQGGHGGFGRGPLSGLMGGLFGGGGNRPSGGIAGGPGQGQGGAGGNGRMSHMPLQGASFWNPRGVGKGGVGAAKKAAPGTPAASAPANGTTQSQIAAGEPNPSTPAADTGSEQKPDTQEDEEEEV